jgi:RHS repeat-associated protein
LGSDTVSRGTPTSTPRNGEPSYTGHQYDQTTGLIYAQARYYDPALGRFLGVDPMAVDTTNAFNFNRYAYANNSPYKFTDPDGRIAWAMIGAPVAAAALLYVGYHVATHPIGNSTAGQSDGLSGLLGSSDTLPFYTPVLNEAATPEGTATDEGIRKAKERLNPAAGDAGAKGQLEGTPEQADEVKGIIGVRGEKEVRRGEGGSAKVGELPDGSKVIDYPSGGGDSYPKGTRTIEIQRPKGRANEKWRFPEPKAPTT